MATGDLIAIEIPATGNRMNLTFEDMATGGTWDLGPWTNNEPTGASIVLTVQCPGYDETGASDPKTRTIYGVPHQQGLTGAGHGVMRKAWVGSGDPVADETDSAGDIVAVIFLSGVLHATDTITNISIAAGTYNDGSADNNAYNADPAGILTYSTTRVYPTPIFSWDSADGAIFGDLLDADFYLAGWARSLYGIAAVRFTVTDESANELDVYVTEQTCRERANGEFAFNHRTALLDLDTFVQGDDLTLRARVYPVIGDVVTDTADYTTAADVGYGRNAGTAICNKTGALTVTRYVAASGGNNGNDGLTDLTPWATLVYAVQQNANDIRCLAGDHVGNIDPGTRKVNTHWFRISPAPGLTAADVGILVPVNENTDLFLAQFEGVTIKASAANCRWTSGADDLLRFRQCVFSRNGQSNASASNLANNFPWLSFEDCTGDFGPAWGIQSPGAAACLRIIGTDVANHGSNVRMTNITLCAGANFDNIGITHNVTEFGHEHLVYQNVSVWNWDSVASQAIALANHDMDNVWLENVLLENLNATPQVFAIGTGKNCQHVVYLHTLQWGQRSAQFYNDSGVTNSIGLHTVARLNYTQEYGTKHDDFGTQNAARVGQWEHMMSVESGWDYTYQDSFPRQFSGLYAFIDDYPTAPLPQFVDDASSATFYGDGTGNGDYRDANFTTNRRSYTPAAWERLVPFDRTGRSRGTNCVSSGGYMYLGPDLPVPNAPTNLAQS